MRLCENSKFHGKCDAMIVFQCSRESCFRSKFRWLIFEEYLSVHDSAALQALNSSDISIDAEITYLNIYNATNQEYGLFDVYNNAFKLGGRLKMARDSTMVVHANGTSLTGSMRTQVAKYLYRDKLTDVTARVGVVVMRIFEFHWLHFVSNSRLYDAVTRYYSVAATELCTISKSRATNRISAIE